MISPRVQRLAAKAAVPLVGLLAAAGLSAAVAATYLTITGESEVGSFSPADVPVDVEAGPTTSTTTPPFATVETTVPPAPPPPAVAPAPAPTPTTAAVARPRSSPTTAAVRPPARAPTTTTTKCDNSGKGNCRSRAGGGGGGDDD